MKHHIFSPHREKDPRKGMYLYLNFVGAFSTIQIIQDIRRTHFCLSSIVYPCYNALITAMQENPYAVDVLIELGADVHDQELLRSSFCTESTAVSLLQAGASGVGILTYSYSIRRMIVDKWADSTIRMVFDSVPIAMSLPQLPLNFGLDFASMYGHALLACMLIDRGATVFIRTIRYALENKHCALANVLALNLGSTFEEVD